MMSFGASRVLSLSSVFAIAACFSVTVGQNELKVGYSSVSPGSGPSVPLGTALFTFRDSSGVLVSQAGVGAVKAISGGRVFVDQDGTRTAIAVVNTSPEPSSLRLELRDPGGALLDSRQRDFGSGEHVALFVDELFPNVPAGFVGSLTFSSLDTAARWAAVTLRQSANQSGQPIFATLPVADTELPSEEGEVIIFPQVGAGAGLSTQIVLINPSATALAGTLRLRDSQGNPLQLELSGEVSSEFPFNLAGNGVLRLQLTRSDGQVGVGYASVETSQGILPVGTALFQFTAPGGVISEAGVASAPLIRKARLFVDNAGTRTGVALANPGAQDAEVRFRLLDREQGQIETRIVEIPGGGHLAIFADELFAGLTAGFTGLLEIESQVELAPVTLKLTVNERGQPILTTLPVVDLEGEVPSEELFFPQVGFGLGFSTRLILINADLAQSVDGDLSFFQSNGSPLVIPIGGEEASRAEYSFGPGGARQFYPGETARLAEILIDAANRTVNQGGTVPLRPITLDEAGNPRDDFALTYQSLSPETIAVDQQGNVTALNRGFSTLLVSSGDLLRRFTVTSGTITSGTGGFQPRDVVQDFAGKIYLANSQDHTVLFAESLESLPEVYAGQENRSGLRNGLRLQAQFRAPSALAVNQGAGGELYISDSENHAIRIVRPGTEGDVATLAGGGGAGSVDGTGSQSRFRSPRGVALDDRGYLWVCDSGNHTIRRIRILDGQVSTVAGFSGVDGFADGKGQQARFSEPVGIVYEAETLVQQLVREQTGAAPPPASVLVADTGNGVLRRVYEDGQVETLGRGAGIGGASAGIFQTAHQNAGFYAFSQPQGLALDPFGNLYVSEGDTGLVKVILRSGQIWLAAERGTFDSPGGMAITIRGRILVAEKNRTVQQIRYAGPSITGIEPSVLRAGGGQSVTIRGRNIAPESLVIVGGVPILPIEFVDTQTLRLIMPPVPSGRQTLTIQHRGGIAQAVVEVTPVRVDDLAPGEITTVVGGTSAVGDGGQATSAQLALPAGVAVSRAGELFVADTGNSRIRRVDPVTGIIRTVAGGGRAGVSDEGLPALVSSLGQPAAVLTDTAGNLLIADAERHQVYLISAESGLLTVLAGTGEAGFSGDGGPARQARLSFPGGLAVDGDGNILISDSGNHRIRKVVIHTGLISTIAGSGVGGFGGDGGDAQAALLSFPWSLILAPDNSLLIADLGNHRIRKVLPGGTITTVAGNGSSGFGGDGGPADAASLHGPSGLALDADGALYISDTLNHRVRKVDGGIIETVAGTGLPGFSGDQGPALAAELNSPSGLVLDASGSLLIADSRNNRVRVLSPGTGTILTAAGTSPDSGGDGSAAAYAVLSDPRGLAVQGTVLLIADSGSHRIRRVETGSGGVPTGSISTVVGTGLAGDAGDEQDPLAALLQQPSGLASSPDGALLIADSGNHRVRELASGQLSLTAGTGEPGYLDDVPGLLARLNLPLGVARDLDGSVLVADSSNHMIRKVDSFGFIGPVAGTGTPGFSGDGERPFLAQLNSPAAVLVAPDGRIFISDTANNRIRVVDSQRSRIETLGGNGQPGFSGDGGPAASARLNAPIGLYFDGSERLYFADSGNHRIRCVDLLTGEIQTVAGSGTGGFQGDGGSALEARLWYPWSVEGGPNGDLLISDQGNGRIRLVKGALEP